MGRIQAHAGPASPKAGRARIGYRTVRQRKEARWTMPILRYLADTNVISDSLRRHKAVLDWLNEHPDEVAISTFALAEIRRGIELKEDGKARRDLQRKFR